MESDRQVNFVIFKTFPSFLELTREEQLVRFSQFDSNSSEGHRLTL